MSTILLYSVTPLLGFMKNYVKYKRVNALLFMRTPFLYLLIDTLMRRYRVNHILLWTLIVERWFLFGYKISVAYLYDHYHRRKNKYTRKYNLSYEE